SIISALPFLPDLFYLSLGFTLVLAVVLSWKTVVRDPLDYDIYIVETQADTQPTRRVAQVMHLGYEERHFAGTEMMNTLAAGRVFPRIEDISVVIQSPSTIVESSSTRERPTNSYINSMRLWTMEVLGDYRSRDEGGGTSGLAAAVAIAVANGRNEIQSGNTRIRLVDFAIRNQMISEEERGRVNGGNGEGEEERRIFNMTSHEENEGDSMSGEAETETPSTASSIGNDDRIMLPTSSSQVFTRSEQSREEERSTVEEPGERSTVDHQEEMSTVDQPEERREEVEDVEEILSDEPNIKIRLKFLDDTGTDLEAPLSITISQLKDRILRERQMGDTGVRLIYRGQLLRNDSETLERIGMENDCVVHVLIGGRRNEERREERREEGNGETRRVVRGEEEGGERREERRDDLEGRLAHHMDYIREVINMSAVLLLGAADAIGSSWLSVARFIRNMVERRVERARREERPLGYIDAAMMRMAEWMGVLEGSPAPLRGIPSVSILLPVILGMQLISAWLFVAFFPRFFDFSSIFFLFIITSTYGFFYRQNHTRINQPQ
ncbi:hypothetical protein PFISCL1PPCAC_10439, partial [Pristionchus fissidentatus]